MNQQVLIEQLLELLESAKVQIRKEALGGSGGGLCNIKGQNIFFLDTEAYSTDIAVKCAEAVARFVDIDAVYIKPAVRQFIENHSHGRNSD